MLDTALVKSINKLDGIAFKYPASATNRVFDSLVKDIQGEDVAPIDYLMYREKGSLFPGPVFVVLLSREKPGGDMLRLFRKLFL